MSEARKVSDHRPTERSKESMRNQTKERKRCKRVAVQIKEQEQVKQENEIETNDI